MLPRTPPHVAGKRPRRLLRLICPLPHAEVNRIAHRAEKIARPRDHSPAMRWQSGCFSSEQAHDLRSRDARSNFIHRNAADHAPGIQNEHRRFRDAAFFARVVDAPLAHHLPLRVAQNCKRQSQPIAHRLRFFRGVHRNGDQLCARRANRRILLAIVRQLAEAERSPVATIKKQHQRTRRAKFRESPRRPGRIRQLKIRSRLARLRRHVANRRCGTSHGYILNEWMPAPLRRFDAPHISCCAVAFFFRSARARCASCIPDDSAGRRFATQCSMAGIWLVGRCDTTLMPFDSAKCSPLSRPPTAQRCEPETGREQDFSLFKLVFGARLLRRNVPILSRYAREKQRFSSGFQLDHFRHIPCVCLRLPLYFAEITRALRKI